MSGEQQFIANPYQILEHDVPEEVVDSVLDHLRSADNEAIRYTQPEWDEMTNSSPNLRLYISQRSRDLAPDDLELRGKITQSLLGFMTLIREARVVEVLEAEFGDTSLDTATSDEPAGVFAAELEEGQDKRKFRGRLLSRSEAVKKPKPKGFHRSIITGAIIMRFARK